MDSYKIKTYFKNSQFYKNYKNIDFILSMFKKIKHNYSLSKNKRNIRLYSLKNCTKKTNKNNSINKILDLKMNIGHNIKNYIKTTDNLNNIFLKSIEIGYFKNINILIKFGADIHYENGKAILLACKNGNINLVKYLVEKGSDIHTEGDLPLRVSISYGHLNIVKYLTKKGANIHARNDCAFRWACDEGYIDIVKFLYEKGSNIHVLDECALRWACSREHKEIVKFLIEKGSNIHIWNDTIIKMAINKKNNEIIKILIESDTEYFKNNNLISIDLKNNLF